MKKNDIFRQAVRELAKAGVRPAMHWGGKHQIISWVGRNGRVYSMPIPGTPSDWRAARNHRSLLRRKLRDGGLIAT